MKKIIKYLIWTSFIKTIYFNIKYFGLEGIKMPVLIARNFRLSKCKGSIVLNKKKPCTIMLGYHDVVLFDRYVERGIWHVEGQVFFNGDCRIGHGCRIVVGSLGKLEFGRENIISANSSICCQKKIVFGNDTIISWGCLFMDTDFHKILSLDGVILNNNKSIVIGNHNWFGCGVTVLKGTQICDNVVIAANSTLSKRICESNCIIAQNGIIAKKDIIWEK